jgi:CRISPR-associated endoribonuclease Cas6
MSPNTIFDESYHRVDILLKQQSTARLPYYGPVVRGWLRDALHQDEYLWKVLINHGVDVNPFFLSTSHKNRYVSVTLWFMGFSEGFIKDIVVSLGSKIESHIGGVDCVIERISYKEEKITTLKIDKRFRIEFKSPTALQKEHRQELVPELSEIVRAITRSSNRFMKYYVKSCYPLHVSGEIPRADVTGFDLKPYLWKHRNVRGDVIPLQGIMGYIDYEAYEMTDELNRILSLTQFFQVGRWIGYGFGRMEVS